MFSFCIREMLVQFSVVYIIILEGAPVKMQYETSNCSSLQSKHHKLYKCCGGYCFFCVIIFLDVS